jgi:hypothetical protein
VGGRSQWESAVAEHYSLMVDTAAPFEVENPAWRGSSSLF